MVIVNPIPALSPVVSDANCFGFCDGSVALNISGGTAPFEILAGELNHGFDGTSIDNNLFTYTGNYTQNESLSTVGSSNNGWGNFFRTTATMDLSLIHI